MKNELIKTGKEKLDHFADTVGQTADPEIAAGIKDILRARREFESTRFIALVVGPVKSGKSTLVNLFAHEIVSPTHFLECTVRPSIIFKGSKKQICQYTLKKGEEKLPAFDSVVDYVRGIGAKEEVESKAVSHIYELNPHNLQLYVELDMNEENVRKDETLITTITIPGGHLLNGETMIIDMPGLDGGYANFDNPLYKQIAERADIILFVQSSNSAITKISKDFFDLLFRKNKKVPVCLIHNVFDAAYWRSETEKRQQVDRQINIALDKIKGKEFNILESFAVNLGKVADAAAYPDNKELQDEKRRFGQMEQTLYEIIRQKRNQIHEEICISKAIDATTNLLLTSCQRRAALEIQKQQLSGLYARFSDFSDRFRTIKVEKSDLEATLERFFDRKRSTWEQGIESLGEISKKNIPATEKTELVRQRIDKFAKDATHLVTDYLHSESYRKAICTEINNKLKATYMDWYAALLAFLAANKISSFPLPEVMFESDFAFSFDGESFKIAKVYHMGGRRREEVCELMNGRKAMFVGYTEQGIVHQGSLQLAVIPQIIRACMQEIDRQLKQFTGQIATMLNQKREEMLPDYACKMKEADAEIKELERMENKLEDIKNLFSTIRQRYYDV